MGREHTTGKIQSSSMTIAQVLSANGVKSNDKQEALAA